MATQRVIAPLTSSNFIFKFAAPSSASSSLRPCQHVFRSFSSAQSPLMASKRKMQTQTAYQPHTFAASDLPPPRTVGGPDTSIAASLPQVNETRPPQTYAERDAEPAKQARISLPEKEAQKSVPVTTSTTPKPKPRPILRARKAAMKLTPSAVEQLRTLLNQPQPKLIKVGVRNKGCSGLAYHLEYVDKKGMLDEEVEQDGVKVIIDSKALMSIIGSEMDWVQDKLNQRFVFINPNIKEQCGCGESFMV